MSINIEDFKTQSNNNRYEQRIKILEKSGKYTQNIKETVQETIENIFKKNVRI